MPKASTFGGRNIPLPHPPSMASKAGHVQLCHRLALTTLTEHPPYENPGYATDCYAIVNSVAVYLYFQPLSLPIHLVYAI